MRVLLIILGCRFFSFITLNISCHSLLTCRVSVEKSADNLMGVPLHVCCCYSVTQCVQLFATPRTAVYQTPWAAFLSFTISRSLLKLVSVELMMPSYLLILCRPLLLLPSIFPSIRFFSKEAALHIRWPKYWSFSIDPSNEYSGLISFRIDWFDLLAVEGTRKSLLQHHSSKVSILWC